MSDVNVGIIVLAAGASLRMGEPKQLLHYQGETLLQRATTTALRSRCEPVIVVLGSQAEAFCEELAATPATIVINQEWEEGMASSIRCGIKALEAKASNQAEAAILMLCDQPFVTPTTLNRLLTTYQTARPSVVASAFEVRGEMTCGVPALFSRSLFSELLNLHGAKGAKAIITKHRNEAIMLATPEAAIDIDTPLDYLTLQAS